VVSSSYYIEDKSHAIHLPASEEQFRALLRVTREQKTGNGWNPEEVSLELAMFKPMNHKIALSICEKQKTKLFGRIFHPKPEEVEVTFKEIEFKPYWYVFGTYQCFYFRKASYKVHVKRDVLAVMVEGRVRGLISEKGALNPFRILEELLTPSSERYFELTDVIEYAHITRSCKLYLDSSGKEEDEFKELFEKYKDHLISVDSLSQIKSITCKIVKNDFKVHDPVKPMTNKDVIVHIFQRKMVIEPKAFLKIAEKNLRILQLKLVYLPIFKFGCRYTKKDQHKTLVIDGVRGKRI